MVKSNQSYYRRHQKKNHGLQNEAHTFEQHSMLFANRKELYVVNGSSINIHNPQGGSLIEELAGHNCKIVNICRNVQTKEEGYVSCDEKGNIFNWYSNRKHPEHGSSVTIPVGEKQRITHFSMSKTYYIYSFVSCDSHLANLALINIHRKYKRKFVLTKQVQIGQYKVAVSYDEKCIAALKKNTVFITDISAQQFGRNVTSRHHKTGFIDQCCVAFHPTKDVMATGGVNGAILLWYHILEKSPIKQRLHWHTMPLRTFSFSSTGGDLFSGGEESVLVRWKLTQDNIKSFLPRLGMPIRNIQTDPSDSLIAVLHSDNSISIIDSENMRLEGSIQRMSKHIPMTMEGTGPLTIGLLYHSPSASFIKNGKTGHLQFFNPQLLKVNYNLDITMANFVTEERHKKLPNSDITNSAISDDGIWLVTVELCHLTPTLKEICMKFWKFIIEQQRWELNTSIQTPHSDEITSLTFKHKSDDVPMCVSCSEDKKFKVWNLITYEDVTGKERSHWNSRISREFRDLTATACAFASDNSLFAVAFEHIITLWTPEEVMLKRLLTQPYLMQRIKNIGFSYGSWEGSALVTRSEDYICSWDLLSCSLMWRVYVQSSCIAIDETSGLMAVFSESKQVYFFEAKSCKPISTNYNIKSEAICALFAEYNELTNDAIRKKESTRCLFYFDKNQNFLRIDIPSVEKKATPKESPLESTTVKSVKTKITGDTSKLMSTLSAKTKNITQKSVDEEVINVSLIAPSMKNLIKDIQEVQIHSASFLEFAAHVSSFIPNLSVFPEKEEKPKILHYETIEQRNERKQASFDKVYLLGEAQRIETLKNVDYHKMLQSWQS